MIAVTHRYAVMTDQWWSLITAERPADLSPYKPYTAFPYAVFDGRYIVTVPTLGL